MIRLILIIIFLFFFFLFSIPIFLIEWIIGRINPHARDISSLRIVQWAFKVILFLAGTRTTVIGMENIPKDEPLVVLSLYDGIATGRYCLESLGYTNIKYYAYEINKHPIKCALEHYPDIKEMGDAFQLRNDDWKLE